MTETTPEARAASDAARASELRSHQYRTDNEQLTSTCSCGTKASTLDIGVHIQTAAEQAAVRALHEFEGLRNL